MEEDPFSQLLRQHFIKVTECLENHVNFDKLTRYSFCSSSDKAIDITEYEIPELEYPQKKSEAKTTSTLNTSSLKVTKSVIIEEEIDGDIIQNDVTNSTISSAVGPKEEREEVITSTEYRHADKFRTEPPPHRPETPTQSMYDFDESETCSLISVPTVRKLETSKKFMYTGSAPVLNDSISSSEDQIVSISNLDDLDDGAVQSTIFDSVHSNEFLKLVDNDRSFEDELEQYKKNIKVEKAIRSLSVNDTFPRGQVKSNNHNVSSFDRCSKSLKREDPKGNNRLPIFDEFSDRSRTFESDKVQIPPNFANTAEYLKYLLEDSNTTVYHGLMNSKSSSSFDLSQEKTNSVVDDDMIESVLTKFMKSQLNIGKSNESSFLERRVYGKEPRRNTETPSGKSKFDTRRYVKMNHLEIQKELTRRIEDMYKAGDGN